MKKKIQKNKKVILLCSGIIFIAVLAISISLLTQEDDFADANFDPESISKIHIKMNELADGYSDDEFVIEESENIAKIIGFVKKMADTELKTDIIGFNPNIYEFTYYMKNGKVKKYSHSFLSVTSDQGFDAVFKIGEVIQQVNHIFTTKYEDIREVKMYLWPSEEAVEPFEYVFIDKNEIDEIIKYGQENMLHDLLLSKESTPLGVEFYVGTGEKPLFFVNISPDMYKYDELCEKVPKVKEFADKLGTQK